MRGCPREEPRAALCRIPPYLYLSPISLSGTRGAQTEAREKKAPRIPGTALAQLQPSTNTRAAAMALGDVRIEALAKIAASESVVAFPLPIPGPRPLPVCIVAHWVEIQPVPLPALQTCFFSQQSSAS